MAIVLAWAGVMGHIWNVFANVSKVCKFGHKPMSVTTDARISYVPNLMGLSAPMGPDTWPIGLLVDVTRWVGS